MWKQVRGQGLVYSYFINPKPNEGLIYLTLYLSNNLVTAYKETKNIFVSYKSY